MIIEIRKAGFVNKGAELMLVSVLKKIRLRYPGAKIVMAPTYGGHSDTFRKMSALDLYPKAWLWRKGIDFGRLASVIPKHVREMYGLVLSREVDVVLDAAGFSYSDQWGASMTKELYLTSKAIRKRGSTLILLPQAFGPFSKAHMKHYVSGIVENSDLVFARENESYNNLISISGEHRKIAIYPDFTNITAGVIPEGFVFDDKQVAIVPNARMMDKTSKNIADAYIPFLVKCAKYLHSRGHRPYVLVHEIGDEKLALRIKEELQDIPVIREENPLHIKGIIGKSRAVIGSRFHGLVSALSQGVPCLGTGWSHKYTSLFEDYDYSEGIVLPNEPDHSVYAKIDQITEQGSAAEIRRKLEFRSAKLKALTEEMWSIVFEKIETRCN